MPTLQKRLSLAIFRIATIVLLATSFIPHHHHFDEACFVLQKCDIDNEINDKHTTHNSSDKENNTDEICSLNTIRYFIPNEEQENATNNTCIGIVFAEEKIEIAFSGFVSPTTYACRKEKAYYYNPEQLRAPPFVA